MRFLLRRTLSIAIIGTLMVSSSFAAEGPSLYSATLRQCHGDQPDAKLRQALDQSFSRNDDQVFWNSLQITLAAEAFNPQALAELYRNKGLSPSLMEKLNSPDYTRALQVCFPNDKLAQVFFTVDEIKSDLRGKMIGTAITGLTLVAGGKALSLLKEFSPVAQKAALMALVSWSSYKSIKALRELTADASPAEQQEITDYVQSNLSQPNKLVGDTKNLLQQEISSLNQDLQRSDLNPEQRSLEIKKMQKLKACLESIS